MMIGAMVFLGCPLRMLLRLAGGDMNALVGLAGLIFGVLIGIFFLKKGFNLGRAVKMPAIGGYILPVVMLALLIFAFVKPGFINASASGHAKCRHIERAQISSQRGQQHDRHLHPEQPCPAWSHFASCGVHSARPALNALLRCTRGRRGR